MAIKVNTRVFNVLNQIIKSTIFTRSEMKNIEAVTSYLETIKEPITAEWITKNKISYLRGLLAGFEIDNSQDEQLKDIHTTPASFWNNS